MVDGRNSIDKRYMYQLISNVQLPGSKTFDSQILMYSCTPEKDVSLAKEFQKHMSKDVYLTIRVNPAKGEIQKARLQRYSLGCVS